MGYAIQSGTLSFPILRFIKPERSIADG